MKKAGSADRPDLIGVRASSQVGASAGDDEIPIPANGTQQLRHGLNYNL